MSSVTEYTKTFEGFTGSALSASVMPMREEAFRRFVAKGFPTTRDEEWKYTNIAPIAAGGFMPSAMAAYTDSASIEQFLIAGKEVHRFVFVNGVFEASLSAMTTMPAGVIAGPLSAHIDHPAVKEHLGKITSATSGAMVDLNTAFISEGAFLYVPASCKVDQPIHFLFINDTSLAPTLVSPRNLLVAKNHANVQVIESFHSLGGVHQGFTNAVTEVLTEQDAILDLTKVQLENTSAFHIGYTAAQQHRQSEFHITTITLDGAIVRNNLNILLSGEYSIAWLYGLYLLNGTQLVDNHSLVDHAVPNCQSNELYKGLIDEKAQGVFNGKIFVRKDAQKTNAYQSNKNILLSDDASMNTKPQLEIFADDVKCSHGTTTGQLDEEALFYLRSRGIGEENAKAFLNIAFAADVIQKIAYQPLRDRLMEMMEKKLKREKF
jgi:Fe-S cluster assembly protein SufD